MKSEKSLPVDPSFDAEIEKLAGEYRASLLPVLEELASLLEHPIRKGARASARRIAHRLHGTAGSYGLENVSRLTGEIQDLLDEKCANALLQPFPARLRTLAGSLLVR